MVKSMVSSRRTYVRRWGMAKTPARPKAAIFAVFFLFILSSLLLAGCVTMQDPESAFDYTGDIVATLESGSSIGQSFISRRSGLNGVQLWLRDTSSKGPDSGNLQVSLYHALSETDPLLTISLPYKDIQNSF